MAIETKEQKQNPGLDKSSKKRAVKERNLNNALNEEDLVETASLKTSSAPPVTQTAQQTNVSPAPITPDTTPMDDEAKALLKVSYRIGAASNANEYHSYSSLLVACMLADNLTSRWFRRWLREIKIEPADQIKKLGLANEELEKLAQETGELPSKAKKLDWTTSALDWLSYAWDFARRRNEQKPEIAVRDLIASFVFVRSFHIDDRARMGLGPANEGAAESSIALANGFMSFVQVHHFNEYPIWSDTYKEEFGIDPAPDIGEGPATRLNSDCWTTDDRLGYSGYARAVRHFLLHPNSKPPLSISIQAPWGAGKTSLMRMIQNELDPEAVNAARHGGWKTINTKIPTSAGSNQLNLGYFLKVIKGEDSFAPAIHGKPPKRYTVWFNAWKYESGDQLWAGLATTIIDQLTARMRPLDREKVLLRLQASRIDPARVRGIIHELAFAKTLSSLRNVSIWLLSAIPLGIASILQGLATSQNEASAVNAAVASNAVPIGVAASLLWAAGALSRRYAKHKKDAEEKEPISIALGDILSVPDYDAEIGFTHKVVEDLQHIFSVLGTTGMSVEDGHSKTPDARQDKKEAAFPPIVVFIDDLDRCSPRKVAEVIEGVNMFLAGDFMPCVFVIGMDPQMVSAALQKAHEEIALELPGYDRHTPLGWRFMDKFVQLPFTIPPAGAEKLGEYTDYLLHGAEVEHLVEKCKNEAEILAETIQSPYEARIKAKQFTNEVANREKLEQPVTEAVERAVHNSLALRFQDRLSERFSDSQPVVREILRHAALGFSNNPRDIKRLLNVVRFNYLLSRTRVASDQSIPDSETMGRWIVLSLRWPAFVRWLQWSPQPIPGKADITPSSGEVRRRLETLERISSDEQDFDNWRRKVHEALNLRQGDIQWDSDPSLREFLSEAKAKHLSEGAGLGFY